MTRLTATVVAALTLTAISCQDDHRVTQTKRAISFPSTADWIALEQAGQGIGDVTTDGRNNGREIVGSPASPAAYIYTDGTDFFIRLRVNDDPAKGADEVDPFGWGLLIDTDGDFSAYEYLIMVDGTGPDQILFAHNTTPGNTGDPNDVAESDVIPPISLDRIGPDHNTVISLAPTNFDGTPDYFLDFTIPLAALTDSVPNGAGLSLTQPLTFMAGTSNNGRVVDLDMAGCDDKVNTCSLTDIATDPTYLDGRRGDPDGDGITNDIDLDDDNDGILDTAENIGLDPDADNDGDGIPNWLDASDRGDGVASTCTDAAADGLCDAPGSDYDSDSDFVPDHLDLDSDNDGIPDITEAGHGGTDANNDGLVDGPYDANGFADALETASESGVANYVLLNTDGTSPPDFQDVDSDGDGVFDIDESGNGALDTNGDGRIDTDLTDIDRDGIKLEADLDDARFGFPGTDPRLFDDDGDGIPDAYDADDAAPGPGDSDSDGTNDAIECPLAWPCPDSTADGQPDYMEADADTDNDGVPDAADIAPADPNRCRDLDTDTCDDCTNTGADGSGGDPADDGLDTDGDGECDAGDNDTDNDGVDDTDDIAPTDPFRCRDTDMDMCDDCTNTGANQSGGDASNDGADTDGDGQCNTGDPDDDNDGVEDGPDVADVDPNRCRDTDGDSCDDCTNTGANLSGGDPLNDGPDADSDGTCDATDTDADNDGVDDMDDSAPADPFVCRDVDNDTCDDCSITGADRSGGDTDNDGLDTDGDGTCDAGEATDADSDGVNDSDDIAPNDPNRCRDVDGDTCDDCTNTGADNSGGDTTNDGPDADSDTICDAGDDDTDNDGVPDADDMAPSDPNVCRDADNDSCDDCTNTGADNSGGDTANDGPDADGDTICDAGDNDGDNDGVPDAEDAAPNDPNQCRDVDSDLCDDCSNTGADGSGGDTTNDGPDANGDGLCNAGDPDGDGVLRPADIDDDNDGIADARENPLGLDPDADNDGDGVANWLDADDQGDGTVSACPDGDGDDICDVPGPVYDTDGDGAPDHIDLDADNDGIPDIIEAGHGAPDANDDGMIDGDVGSNGLDNSLETSADSGEHNYVLLNTDGDGFPDFQDIDSDDDGEFDIAEVSLLAPLDGNDDGRIDNIIDPDRDGLADPVDAQDDAFGHPTASTDPASDDTDGDNIPNAYDADDEGANAGDSDSDGLNDNIECPTGWLCRDGNADGVPDYMEDPATVDSDGDGVNDSTDLDDDNDGILDTDENTLGLSPGADADGDNVPNYADSDDRGDGMANDCIDTTPADGFCDTLPQLFDEDGDGVPNHLDLDSDGDTIADNDESGHNGPDADNDGRVDGDVGANGLPDAVETGLESGETAATANTDGDDQPDFLDLDTDGDTIADAHEAGDGLLSTDPVDTDNDGAPDYRDLDTDGDNITDAEEAGDDDLSTAPIDTDSDSAADFRDLDSDGDEVSDEVEAGDDDPTTAAVDTDGDGDADFVDRDSDNDGVDDATDNCRLIANPDQADGNEDDVGDACTNSEDSDNDGVPNDQDNCPDNANPGQENQDRDELGDACDRDADGNGYDDALGIQGGGCSSTTGNSGVALPLMALVLGLLLFRRRRWGAVVAGLLTLALYMGPASGQAVSRDYSAERFRLAVDRNGVLGVEWAQVPRHLHVDVGLWLGFADDPINTYEVGGDGERDRTGSLVGSRLGAELVGSIGIMDHFALGLVVPVILSQSEDLGSVMAGGAISSGGLGDVRLLPKAQFLRQSSHGVGAAVILGLQLPTSTSSDFLGDSDVVFAPELAVSRDFTNGIRAGANVGYRLRKKNQSLDLTVDDEVFAHIGLGYRLGAAGGPPLELAANFAIATGANDVLGAFNRNYAEVKFGAAYAVTKPVLLILGTGIGVAEGYGTPDWRVFGGLRFGTTRAVDKAAPKKRIVAKADPVDSDGDGLLDPDDKCPDKPETKNDYEDDDGCPDEIPDTDGDGLTDPQDKCPTEPEDKDGHEDNDGCPDPDNDGDGIPDTEDKCRDEAGVKEMQGCPDPDRDGDTVVDRLDNCPDVPGKPELQGCKKKQLVTITANKLEILDVVYFRTNKAIIQRRSYKLLDNVAAVLAAHPELTSVQVEGHTDDRGSDRYNKSLSQRRAEAVVVYLTRKGIDRARLTALGYGEEKPIADNKTKTGRAINRRVEFKIMKSGSGVQMKRSDPTDDTIGK